MIPLVVISALAFYLVCGLAFAIPFALIGISRIDPHAAHGSWGFRCLVIPGAAFLWPMLAGRWFSAVSEPPAEQNAHRRAAHL